MVPNEQQKIVIEHGTGPALVTAVPGSGKTACITERVKRLVDFGVDPIHILAITFTNKAANEMRERITKAIGPENASKVIVSTFHSLCVRMLRHCGHLIGLGKGFTIYDTDAQQKLIRKCIKKSLFEDFEEDNERFSVTKSSNMVLSFIETMRNKCMTEAETLEYIDLDKNELRAVKLYFDEMKANNAVDFTGMITYGIRLLKENNDIRERYRNRWKYISVDEVQDTNVAQYEFLKLLALGHKNILCVGDFHQSIYGWRNATPQNIEKFRQDFGAKIVKLEKNYRSSPQILGCCQKLIEKNKSGIKTELKTDNPDGDLPVICSYEDDLEMASSIATKVNECLGRNVPPSEIVVLFRTNSCSRVIEQEFVRRKIPFRLIGGHTFFDRKEVKVGLDVLRLMVNDQDRITFDRVCEECCRGIGPKTMALIENNSEKQGISVLKAASDFVVSNPKKGGSLKTLLDAFSAAQPMPGEKMIEVFKRTGFMARMDADSSLQNDRVQNIEELAHDVDTYMAGSKANLSTYLQNITLQTDDDTDEENKVKIMTMHGSKGLEFDVVFVSHCNSYYIPHYRVFQEEDTEAKVEEERRLMYVAMSRARKKLFLCFSKIREFRGNVTQMKPSPFLWETGLKMPNGSRFESVDNLMVEADSDAEERFGSL